MDSLAKINAEAFSGGKSIGTITVVNIGEGHYLRADAAEAFGQLKSLAEADGVDLHVDSAFRSMNEQQRLYRLHLFGELSTPVAKPGHSNHQSGIALDIAVHRSNTSSVYKWLDANAPPLGWHNVGARFRDPEYWHWEFTPPPPKESP